MTYYARVPRCARLLGSCTVGYPGSGGGGGVINTSWNIHPRMALCVCITRISVTPFFWFTCVAILIEVINRDYFPLEPLAHGNHQVINITQMFNWYVCVPQSVPPPPTTSPAVCDYQHTCTTRYLDLYSCQRTFMSCLLTNL